MDSNVIVTGFGPFGNHEVNASWEAVKLLPEEIDGCRIIKEQVQVAYNVVNERIPDLWTKHQPKLMIHVGVSDSAKQLTLETCAHLDGYERKDVSESCPDGGKACPSNFKDDRIVVGLNLQNICDRLNESGKIEACLSTAAGRFLCEYIYYTSLSFNKDRAIFIHVPPLNSPYSAQELADGIQEVISLALKQCIY